MKKIGLKSINLRYLLGKTNLKRDLLYFDQLIFDENELKMSEMISDPIGHTLLGNEFEGVKKFQLAELDYLQEKELLLSYDSSKLQRHIVNNKLEPFHKYFEENKGTAFFSHSEVLNLASAFKESTNLIYGVNENGDSIFKNYLFSEILNSTSEINTTPILDLFIPEKESQLGKEYKILEVVLKKFPIISEQVSWDELIEFKNDPDSKRKFLALRNWMIDISKGDYSSNEISEKFDFLYSEYTSHIERHNLKTNFGTLKTFSISASEILEDLVRVKWSKAVKAGFEIFEKNSKLTQVESNAPGKEVAFVHSINEKLNKNSSQNVL